MYQVRLYFKIYAYKLNCLLTLFCLKIKAIFLNNNEITSIDSRGIRFKCLTTLKKLDLSDNNLTELDPKLFQRLPTLKKIRLKNNKLTYLDPQIFDGVNDLIKIDISHNLISNIDSKTFSHLSDLVNLNLSHNLIVSLDHSTFKGLQKVYNIDLSFNSLTSIEKDTYNLSVMKLDGNFLTKKSIIKQNISIDLNENENKWFKITDRLQFKSFK